MTAVAIVKNPARAVADPPGRDHAPDGRRPRAAGLTVDPPATRSSPRLTCILDPPLPRLQNTDGEDLLLTRALRRPAHPPPLAHERLTAAAPDLAGLCATVAGSVRQRPGFDEASTVVTTGDLASNLQVQQFLRGRVGAAGEVAGAGRPTSRPRQLRASPPQDGLGRRGARLHAGPDGRGGTRRRDQAGPPCGNGREPVDSAIVRIDPCQIGSGRGTATGSSSSALAPTQTRSRTFRPTALTMTRRAVLPRRHASPANDQPEACAGRRDLDRARPCSGLTAPSGDNYCP
jgi:hypothetical protein